MKTFQTFAVTLVALSFLLTTSPANAIKPGTDGPVCSDLVLVEGDPCYAALAYLCDATATARPPLKQRDIDGLVGKVVHAGDKIAQDKIEDAEWKLANYEFKLDQLVDADKEKINPDDAGELTTLLYAAQTCVISLGYEGTDAETAAISQPEPDATVTQESTTQSETVATTTEETTTVLEPAPDATQDTTTVSEPTTSVTGDSTTQ